MHPRLHQQLGEKVCEGNGGREGEGRRALNTNKWAEVMITLPIILSAWLVLNRHSPVQLPLSLCQLGMSHGRTGWGQLKEWPSETMSDGQTGTEPSPILSPSSSHQKLHGKTCLSSDEDSSSLTVFTPAHLWVCADGDVSGFMHICHARRICRADGHDTVAGASTNVCHRCAAIYITVKHSHKCLRTEERTEGPLALFVESQNEPNEWNQNKQIRVDRCRILIWVYRSYIGVLQAIMTWMPIQYNTADTV